MILAVRRGGAMRAVARRFGVGLSHLQFWAARARGKRLDRVVWSDRPAGRRSSHGGRASSGVERAVCAARRTLAISPLGECGAAAIRALLRARTSRKFPVPSLRTIGRILRRCGLLDARARVRRPPPPRGWYLPPLAARRAELDSFDLVEGLLIKGGPPVEVLNVVSLHGALAQSWPRAHSFRTDHVLGCVCEHWRAHGLPDFAQFDNDTLFQGPHQHPDAIGRVIRLCLQLGVVPVFAPPRETGFQAQIEGFNARWQAMAWHRWRHRHLPALCGRSAAFISALRAKNAVRIASAPPRRPWPAGFLFEPAAPLRGRLIFLRRCDDDGRVHLLARSWPVSSRWAHRLVRAELDFERRLLRFFALRRSAPALQPLLASSRYRPLPSSSFH